MNIPAEQRINMSLDDVIKASAKEKKAQKTAQKVKNANTNAAKNAARPKKNSSKSLTPNSSTSQVIKTAKVIGASKAKRSAAVDQRRGIRKDGTATKAEVKKEATKAVANRLKISFSPKDLPNTTEKVVSQQIRAVLAHQGSKKKSGGASRPSLTPRKDDQKTAKKTGKARGKNIVLTVKH